MRGHTWNKKLAIYKSFREHARVLEEELPIETTGPESINIIDCQTSGIKEVKIFIEHADIRYRMDKLLAGQLVGWSRTQIVQYIKSGLIRLNDRSTKPGTAVCTNDCIRILLDSL
ncbi:S4 domain-containing protein [Brevibacillus invocatus]|uniref:S4 domain-containing protein n=1 Tax=Brevibacillus invocatus TaxID=173959 RepID=UPI0011CD3FDE|nr:S4 domain-containing protein [Brevibacillus invocatus]MCM3081290.1 S4 domain-containing protein [Brevibacillus invocatus]